MVFLASFSEISFASELMRVINSTQHSMRTSRASLENAIPDPPARISPTIFWTVADRHVSESITHLAGIGFAERLRLLVLLLVLLLLRLEGGHQKSQHLRPGFPTTDWPESGSSLGIFLSLRRGLSMRCDMDSSYNSFSRRDNTTSERS